MGSVEETLGHGSDNEEEFRSNGKRHLTEESSSENVQRKRPKTSEAANEEEKDMNQSSEDILESENDHHKRLSYSSEEGSEWWNIQSPTILQKFKPIVISPRILKEFPGLADEFNKVVDIEESIADEIETVKINHEITSAHVELCSKLIDIKLRILNAYLNICEKYYVFMYSVLLKIREKAAVLDCDIDLQNCYKNRALLLLKKTKKKEAENSLAVLTEKLECNNSKVVDLVNAAADDIQSAVGSIKSSDNIKAEIENILTSAQNSKDIELLLPKQFFLKFGALEMKKENIVILITKLRESLGLLNHYSVNVIETVDNIILLYKEHFMH